MESRQTTTSPVRVALRIADGPSPAYLVAAADAVLQVGGAQVVLFLVTVPDRGHRSVRGRLVGGIDRLYEWLERRTLRGGPAALTSSRRRLVPEGVPVVRDTKFDDCVAALLEAEVDVLIDLAPDAAREALPVPNAGGWSLRYAVGIDGTRRPRITRPRKSMDLAESLLAIELPDGVRLEAEAGVSALRRIGYCRDRDAVYWRASMLPARQLARSVAGETAASKVVDPLAPGVVDRRPGQRPNRDVPPFVGLAMTLVRRVVERLLFRTSWLVLVRTRGPNDGPPLDLSGFDTIEAPVGRFYADPFVVAMPDGPRLYVEDCPAGAHRGRISTLRVADDGRWELERIVLADLEHRAYPHALSTGAGLVVTPDSGRSGGVDLFLDRGPENGLERVGRCLEGVPASDPTLLWHDGLYWLFVTVTGHGMSPWDELHLYSSAVLDGVWHPHPGNPVVADVRCARPAGRIFQSGAALVRPGQDCSEAYGHRIVLSAITTLTPDHYEEHPIGSIEPEGLPGIKRTHTYSFDGSIEVLDGYLRVVRRPRRGRARR